MAELEARLASATTALAAGDWATARDAFREALEIEEAPEALNGLGDALWWLGETPESIEARERAYVLFRRHAEPGAAANIALGLALHYRANDGNAAASAGWLGRAARLIEEFEVEELRGWLALSRGDLSDDPVAGERLAREAREHAARSGDLDLDLCALAEIGARLVEQGRVEEGIAMLDEAMAGSLGGEPGNFDTVVYTSCSMIGACAKSAEFERAVQWIRAADRFTKRYGCPFLFVYCRTLYGRVLLATGDWVAADAELRTALRNSGDAQPAMHAAASATLAALRLAQGRFEDAERLLADVEPDVAAAPVRAALHLARGEPARAASAARRALESLGDDQLERAAIVELLGEAEIAVGEHEAAARRGRELAEAGTALGTALMRAHGDRLHGHALVTSDPARARPLLQGAVDAFGRLGMPFEVARTRLLLALRLATREVAVAEAAAALAAFEALGAGGAADQASSFLRGLGVKAARAGPRGVGALTKREEEVLVLVSEGLSNPEIAQRLYLSRKTVEHHVASVLAKLGVRGRAEAAAEAVRRHGVDPPRNG